MVKMQSGGKRLRLSEIDEDIKLPRTDGFNPVGGGIARRFQGVMGERQSPTICENTSVQAGATNLPTDSNGVKS